MPYYLDPLLCVNEEKMKTFFPLESGLHIATRISKPK